MVTIAPTRQQAQVCIGKAGLPVGSLTYVRQGRRENCAFAYDEAWLAAEALERCGQKGADMLAVADARTALATRLLVPVEGLVGTYTSMRCAGSTP